MFYNDIYALLLPLSFFKLSSKDLKRAAAFRIRSMIRISSGSYISMSPRPGEASQDTQPA